jgi:hypothetical protein
MKKIMISLLMVAATMSVMAQTYTSYAQVTLTSTTSYKSCTMTVAVSEDFSAGLNDGYYAELNTEGKDVQLYVLYGGVKYQQLGSNAATMKDLQIGIKTDAAGSYTLKAKNVSGSKTLKLMINGVTYELTNSLNETITLEANKTLPASAADAEKYMLNPAVPEIAFNNDKLQIADATQPISVKKEGVDITGSPFAATTTEIDLSTQAAGRYVVNFEGKDYQIDVKVKDIPEAKYHIVTP